MSTTPERRSLADRIRSEAAIADRSGQMVRLERIANEVEELTRQRDTHKEVAESMSGLWQSELDRANRLERMADALAGKAVDLEGQLAGLGAMLGEQEREDHYEYRLKYAVKAEAAEAALARVREHVANNPAHAHCELRALLSDD